MMSIHQFHMSPDQLTDNAHRPPPQNYMVQPQFTPNMAMASEFESPDHAQLASRMNGFHLKTPVSQSSPVFNYVPHSMHLAPVAPVTPTFAYSHQMALQTPTSVGSLAPPPPPPPPYSYPQQVLSFSPGVQQHLFEVPLMQPVDPPKLKKKQSRSSIKKTSTPKRRSKEHLPDLLTENLVLNNLPPLVDDLELYETSEQNITIDDLLKDDPLAELTSPHTSRHNSANDYDADTDELDSLLMIDYVDLDQYLAPTEGLGLLMSLQDPSTVSPTTITEFSSPALTSPSPKKHSRTPSQGTTSSKKLLSSPSSRPSSFDRTLRKAQSFASFTRKRLSPSAPKFSLEDCCNEIALNTTNSFLFVYENSLPDDLRRSSVPKLSRPQLKKSVSLANTSVAAVTKHKPLKSMASGMGNFQVQIRSDKE